jgi:hypothetical protein
MSIFKSLLCQNGAMITFYVFDVILILCAIGISIWFYIKYVKPQKDKKVQETELKSVEKIDDDTYIIETDAENSVETPVEEEQPKTNRVEHFANQISEINEPSTNELKSNTVVVNKTIEMPEKKIVKKEEIENYVIIDGVKKEKTESEKKKSLNHGANAFKNSTNFLKSINDEQDDNVKSSKKTSKK